MMAIWEILEGNARNYIGRARAQVGGIQVTSTYPESIWEWIQPVMRRVQADDTGQSNIAFYDRRHHSTGE